MSYRALGEVTVAESLYTPGDMTGAGQQINTAAQALNTDITSHAGALLGGGPDKARLYNEWLVWYTQRWQPFFRQLQVASGDASASGLREWLSSTVRADGQYASGSLASSLHNFANEYNGFEVRYRSLIGAPTLSTHSYVSWGDWFSRMGDRGLMWAGVGILGLGVTGYVLAQWAKIRTVSKILNNNGRRRRRRR